MRHISNFFWGSVSLSLLVVSFAGFGLCLGEIRTWSTEKAWDEVHIDYNNKSVAHHIWAYTEEPRIPYSVAWGGLGLSVGLFIAGIILGIAKIQEAPKKEAKPTATRLTGDFLASLAAQGHIAGAQQVKSDGRGGIVVASIPEYKT